MRFTKSILFVALLGLFIPYAAVAQTKSNVAPITVNYSVPESLSISVSGGPLLIPASGATASNTGTITGSYNLNSGHTQGILFAIYPAGGVSAAMSAGSVNVPSSSLTVWAAGASFGVCNQADTFGLSGAADQCVGTTGYGTLLTQTQVATAGYSGSLPSEAFAVAFVSGSVPTQAGNYSGTLDVIAFAP
jgi:hypothetical protein